MWPKNLAYYRLTDEIDLGELARAAATKPFVPCQGLDWTSTGFVTVVTDQYLLVAKDKARLTIRTDTKVFMPTLQARLVRCEQSPSSLMTEWFTAGQAGEEFEMGASCTLRAPGDDGREITVKRADLSDDEIRALTSRGEQCTALSLIWNERIMAKLMDTGHLKGLRFLDTMQEEASASAEEGDLEALASATLLITCDGVTGLINDYITHAGGEI